MVPVVHVLASQPGAGRFILPVVASWINDTPLPSDWTCRFEPNAARFLRGEFPEGLMLDDWESTLAVPPGGKAILLASATSNGLEHRATHAVRQAGGRVIQYLDTPYLMRDRIFATNEEGVWPDHVLVIDEVARTIALEEGIPASVLTVVGHPAWERVRPLDDGPAGTLLFISQPVDRDHELTLGYTQFDALNLLQDAQRASPDLIRRLLVLPHPRETPSTFAEYEGVEIYDSPDRALRDASIVTGMFSSLMIESALMGKPVITLQPAETPQPNSLDYLVRRKLSAIARTPEEVAAAIAGVGHPPAVAGKPDNEFPENLFKGSIARLNSFVRQEIAVA